MTVWGQPSKGRSKEYSVISTEESPAEHNNEVTSLSDSLLEETAQRTKELLATQGWCLWKCSILGGDIISIVRGELSEEAERELMNYLIAVGVTEGALVYTEAELEELCRGDVREATLRLVHEAKKLAGAEVTGKVINNKEAIG